MSVGSNLPYSRSSHTGQRKIQRKQRYFARLNPILTFLNIPQLERQGAYIQTKVEELEMVNQSLRNRDRLKDDAIAQLSDQIMALSTRLQEIERRQLA
jgi:MFS superfamily sulfate permease-like transporter